MGCLKKILLGIIKKILIIGLIVAFFAFGGWAFVKEKVKAYQNPSREEFVETEKNYGDFSSVSSDYQLCRIYNLFGYKKIHAKYLPTGQKITIYDLKDEDKISQSDFITGEIDEKIKFLLDKTKDSLITFQNFEIIEKGKYQAKNKEVPYIKFSANVKNVPFKDVIGIVGAYSSINVKTQKVSTKLVVTMTDTKAFNPVIPRDFVQAIKF